MIINNGNMNDTSQVSSEHFQLNQLIRPICINGQAREHLKMNKISSDDEEHLSLSQPKLSHKHLSSYSPLLTPDSSKSNSCMNVSFLETPGLSRHERPGTLGSKSSQEEYTYSTDELEFKEVLGEGFFGRVTKVTPLFQSLVVNKRTKHEMVMKELKICDKETEKQFKVEIELLRLLNHPNLLKYKGVVNINEKINIILEYIPGGTLRKLIKNKSVNLTKNMKWKIAHDISSGMAYLHSMNVAHRDLTSKNCLVRDLKNIEIVVTDFGLSRVINRLSINGNLEKAKLDVVGTPYWMAPEMLCGKDYDLRVDIFSYGIILCEVLGRINAHPDHLPRLHNFGLDEQNFRKIIQKIDNPPHLIDLAVECCNINPDKRPLFKSIKSYIKLNSNIMIKSRVFKIAHEQSFS